MKSKYQFNKSQQVAISFLCNFPEATNCWKNFTWFHQMTLSKIEEVGEDFSGGSKFIKIKREISFYGYRDILIAQVHLEGTRFTNSDQRQPTFWKVVEIEYSTNYDESRTFLEQIWNKVTIEEKDQILI